MVYLKITLTSLICWKLKCCFVIDKKVGCKKHPIRLRYTKMQFQIKFCELIITHNDSDDNNHLKFIQENQYQNVLSSPDYCS